MNAYSMSREDLAKAVTKALDALPEGSRNSARQVLLKDPADWNIHELEHMQRTLDWFDRVEAAAKADAAAMETAGVTAADVPTLAP
jgi:hypothetical protein